MLQYVYKVSNPDEVTIFHADTGREAAEKMIYTLNLDDKQDYRINELKHGYEIALNGDSLYWVRK
jgi:3'-phosphoadenosine 5'-phosphosulfate sulfotransferase (PAPS reductase)/FAD synthetase